MLHVYKQHHPIYEMLYFVFVSLPVAGIVIGGVYAVFFIIDILRWLKSAVVVVRSYLSGRTKMEASIVKGAGSDNRVAV